MGTCYNYVDYLTGQGGDGDDDGGSAVNVNAYKLLVAVCIFISSFVI